MMMEPAGFTDDVDQGEMMLIKQAEEILTVEPIWVDTYQCLIAFLFS